MPNTAIIPGNMKTKMQPFLLSRSFCSFGGENLYIIGKCIIHTYTRRHTYTHIHIHTQMSTSSCSQSPHHGVGTFHPSYYNNVLIGLLSLSRPSLAYSLLPAKGIFLELQSDHVLSLHNKLQWVPITSSPTPNSVLSL